MKLPIIVALAAAITGAEPMQTYYIEAPWAPGKLIIVKARNRLEAVSKTSITVWEEDDLKEAAKGIPEMDMPEMEIEFLDYRNRSAGPTTTAPVKSTLNQFFKEGHK